MKGESGIGNEASEQTTQMAVFLVNNCTFQGCGLTFPSLSDLIQHIEDTHIDTDPKSLERQELQQPASLALSYVLRYYTDAARREQCDIQKKRIRAHSPAVSLPESTPTGSEVDEEEIQSDDENSDDSWTMQEEFPSEMILSMMGGRDRDTEGERPYGCPVPGCKKRYKNVNGIKYHARHAHKKESKVRKTFRCFCGKSYKSLLGIRNHTAQNHPSTELPSTPVTLTQNLLSPLTTMSPPSLLTAKDVPSPDHVTPPLANRLAAPTSLSSSKLGPPLKAITMAAIKGQGQSSATLALPISAPMRFVGQSTSVVPVPVALKSLKFDSASVV